MIWLVRIAGHWVLKQEAMGFGDVTLMAAIGSFLGWQQALVIFFMAPLLGIVFALANWFLRRERELPYGPFLAMAALLYLCAFQFLWEDHLEATFGYGPFLVLLLVIGGLMFVPLLTLSRLIRRALGIPDPEPLDLGKWRGLGTSRVPVGPRWLSSVSRIQLSRRVRYNQACHDHDRRLRHGQSPQRAEGV